MAQQSPFGVAQSSIQQQQLKGHSNPSPAQFAPQQPNRWGALATGLASTALKAGIGAAASGAFSGGGLEGGLDSSSAFTPEGVTSNEGLSGMNRGSVDASYDDAWSIEDPKARAIALGEAEGGSSFFSNPFSGGEKAGSEAYSPGQLHDNSGVTQLTAAQLTAQQEKAATTTAGTPLGGAKTTAGGTSKLVPYYDRMVTPEELAAIKAKGG